LLTSIEDVQRIQARVLHTIEHGLEFDLTTEQGKHFLKRHVNANTTLVVLFIDINGSTQMSITLSPPKFAVIVQVFSQEARLAILGHGGYVLKYVGDSVIGIFPAEFNKQKACKSALDCAESILSVIRECINPVLTDHKLPQITVKVGLDIGTSSVILYGKRIDSAPIDLIGPSISIASKITSVAQPNQILVGKSIYETFLTDPSLRNRFARLKLRYNKWNYIEKTSGNIYELHTYH
jgi:class 3 adenylate cyclase